MTPTLKEIVHEITILVVARPGLQHPGRVTLFRFSFDIKILFMGLLEAVYLWVAAFFMVSNTFVA